MNIQPISQSEIYHNRVASLPARPNASAAFGGNGYTSAEMRAAFDRLPLLITERFNALVGAISSHDVGSLADLIPTGVIDGNGEELSLRALLAGIGNGSFAGFVKVGDGYLDLLPGTLAPRSSPAFTGEPSAPTPASGDNSGRLATTAWVRDLLGSMNLEAFIPSDGEIAHPLPGGGEAGDFLTVSDETDAPAWTAPGDVTFPALHVETASESEQDGTTVVNIAYVTRAIGSAVSNLIGGAAAAYDTLGELATALESRADLATVLEAIAEKEPKTSVVRFASGATLTLPADEPTEYRANAPVSSLTVIFPAVPADLFLCGMEFSTGSSAPVLTYPGDPDLYADGADCEDGVFTPIKNTHYSLVIWHAGGKFQMTVRRSA